MPSGPPQAWVNRAPATAGTCPAAWRADRGRPLRPRRTRLDGGAEVVRRTAAAEDEAVVGGALAVDDDVPVVGERLPALQPRLVPEPGGEGLGRDHERVDGDDLARARRRRPRLGGAHDVPGPDRAAVGADAAGRDLRGPGALDDPPAAAFDRLRQAPRQTQGVDAGAVRGVRGAEGAGHADGLAGLLGVQQSQPLRRPGALVRRDLGRGPGQLRLAAGHDDGAAAAEVAVDPLGLHDALDLVDRAAHGLPHGAGGGGTVLGGQGALPLRQQGRAPAAVAAARPEPDPLGLDDEDRRDGSCSRTW